MSQIMLINHPRNTCHCSTENKSQNFCNSQLSPCTLFSLRDYRYYQPITPFYQAAFIQSFWLFLNIAKSFPLRHFEFPVLSSWNGLPPNTCMACSLTSFGPCLNYHLFREDFFDQPVQNSVPNDVPLFSECIFPQSTYN